MAFGGLILTNKGRNLQVKAQLGTQLTFTRMAVGDGELGGSSILELNALKHEIKSLPLSKYRRMADGKALVGAVLSNQDLVAGFYFREIGILAEDPDEGEVLYCYGNAGATAEYIPAGGGADILEKSIDVITIVGNAENVSATIEQSLVYASAADLELHVNAEAPHSGHATLDAEGKVPVDQLPAMDYVPISDVGAPGGVAKQDEFESHKAETATQVHLAKNIGLEDAGNHFAATDIEGALSELFQSVSNGKGLLETAIPDKEGTVSKQGDIAAFVELDTGIRSIPQKPPQGEQTFLSSGTFIPPAGVEFIDVFMVGGGGGGGYASPNSISAGGGGGGYVRTIAGLPVIPGKAYAVAVGAGGNGYMYNTSYPSDGGESSIQSELGIHTASGGKMGSGNWSAGDGGSGGGMGNNNTGGSYGGAGGSDGANGTIPPGSSTTAYNVGRGQLISTKAWGQSSGTLYGGGGGGGGRNVYEYGGTGGSGGAGGGGKGGDTEVNPNALPGTNGTGGGGGGMGAYANGSGRGGSGIVIVRWGY